MKKPIIILSTFLFLCCTISPLSAQINRTLSTKVADILAQMPTKNLEHSNALMEEIISLKTAGILQFCDLLVPLGSGDDTQARYAIQSLSIYAGGKPNEANIVEDALLKALENASDNEIKTFLIERLFYCGSNTSIAHLNYYLNNDKLYKPALATLTAIGTTDAAKAILNTVKNSNGNIQSACINALGVLKYQPATEFMTSQVSSKSITLRQNALMALANIAAPNSYNTLFDAAKKAKFISDDSKAILAFIHYGIRLENTNPELSIKISKSLLKYCKSETQLHFRTAALQILNKINDSSLTKLFLKEFKHENKNYRGAVLELASKNLTTANVSKWVKAFKSASPAAKAQIVNMLAKTNEAVVFNDCILPAIKHTNQNVKISGLKALAYQDKSRAFPQALQSLANASTSAELNALRGTLLRLCDAKDNSVLAANLIKINHKSKAVLIDVLAARKATTQFDKVISFTDDSNEIVKNSAFVALSSIATTDNLSQLIELLQKTENEQHIANIQAAIINVLDQAKTDQATVVFEAYKATSRKENIISILPVLRSNTALQLVIKSLHSENSKENSAALEALSKWRTNDAIPYLFKSASININSALRSKSFVYYLSQVNASSHPNDQKLLLIKKLLPFCKNIEEQKRIINSVSRIKTFLALVFVSNYLDTDELIATASNAAIRIALPTPGKKDNLSGDVVREIISKSINNLNGPDSQYVKIDVTEFLEKMPNDKGFVSIFNGTNLEGWEGLVENPIAREKMSENDLAKAQEKANTQMLKDWFVKEGVIGFKGEGYNNICTIKDYGDFEMLVDWKITNGGDSGIYLRGTPQVQIWDIARTNVGAEVGSGGLYNNQKNNSKPIVVADNPINDWNTFRIKMVGERVTVHLNGILVTDNIALENYWDRSLPIFTKEAIELQAHGEDLGFRNIYVREITSGDMLLTDQEREAGFKSLFNGKDLDHWVGNKKDYFAENNELVVRPEQGGHGNLYTAEEYSDFNFRFEFKLTPGANNGLGIHAPLEGDAAYVGKELQILDNTAAIYKNLKPYQYHGSVYGVIPAKRGFLKPVGEWNSEEVIVKGNHITIVLNGTVIVDGNMKEASKNGTIDKKDHPGLKRNNGHIGFLGHGSELQFRNIRIKDIKLD